MNYCKLQPLNLDLPTNSGNRITYKFMTGQQRDLSLHPPRSVKPLQLQAIQRDAVSADLRGNFGEEFLQSHGFRAAALWHVESFSCRRKGTELKAAKRPTIPRGLANQMRTPPCFVLFLD